MKKETLLRYCSSMEQVARVRPITCRDGHANGLNAVEIKNGPLGFILMQDKGNTFAVVINDMGSGRYPLGHGHL